MCGVVLVGNSSYLTFYPIYLHATFYSDNNRINQIGSFNRGTNNGSIHLKRLRSQEIRAKQHVIFVCDKTCIDFGGKLENPSILFIVKSKLSVGSYLDTSSSLSSANVDMFILEQVSDHIMFLCFLQIQQMTKLRPTLYKPNEDMRVIYKTMAFMVRFLCCIKAIWLNKNRRKIWKHSFLYKFYILK